VIIHQAYFGGGFKGLVKRWVSGRADIQVAVSHRMTHEFSQASVIPNPYDDKLFRTLPDGARTKELIFVGRLVSAKGVSLLLKSVRILIDRRVLATLTIAGDGPERGALETEARELGLSDAVTFAGFRLGTELVELLNEHKVMVVPSRWQEPFGIVALEGLASGCAVVVADRGGLPEAVGSVGLVFEGDDPALLADVIERALTSVEDTDRRQSDISRHLARHHPKAIAAQYLELFKSVVT
jgi:glycogen(starch) synthase